MTIDGYYIPDGLLVAVRSNAKRLGRQCVGVKYIPPDTVPGTIMSHFFSDMRTGRYCAWEYGPTADELRQMPNMATILWITKEAA